MSAEPGASHAKRGRPSAATLDLLSTAHAALRDELADTLAELRPAAADPGQLTLDGKPKVVRPSLADRKVLVALVGDLMRLLGSEIVAAPAEPDAAPARRRRRARPDFGP